VRALSQPRERVALLSTIWCRQSWSAACATIWLDQTDCTHIASRSLERGMQRVQGRLPSMMDMTPLRHRKCLRIFIVSRSTTAATLAARYALITSSFRRGCRPKVCWRISWLLRQSLFGVLWIAAQTLAFIALYCRQIRSAAIALPLHHLASVRHLRQL
jgi:type VI protein secretion system component VasK